MFEELKDRVTKTFSKAAAFLGEGEQVIGGSVYRKTANESVAIDIAKIKEILPYDKEEKGIFYNKGSIGFGFELAPKSGADESLVASLSEFIKNKLHKGLTCQFMLYKHGHIQGEISNGLDPFLQKGGIYKMLAEKSLEFHKRGVETGYTNKQDIPVNLCDYKLYVFFATKTKEGAFNLMSSLKNSISSELNVIGFNHRVLNRKSLCEFVRCIATPDLKDLFWPSVNTDAIDTSPTISYQCVKEGSLLHVSDDLIDISVPNEKGGFNNSLSVNLSITKSPEKMALWQSSDLFANIYKSQKTISCPFLITFVIEGENQDKMRMFAKQKVYGLTKNNNAMQNFINPYLKNELSEWTDVSEGLNKEEIALLPTCYNLTLFTDEENKEKHVAQAVGNYRELGFELKIATCSQWLRFLVSLPFMSVNGFLKDLKKLDEVKLLTSNNIVNMLPVVADFKGSNSGVLMPTLRNQLFYMNDFDDKSLNIDSYNYLVSGTTGSGKSAFTQGKITYSLANGEKVFVIDLGASYKHLCETMGGIYVDASTISLNPFTLFDFEGEVEVDGEIIGNYIQIRDLIAIMASPSKPLEDIQLSYLLDGVLDAWTQKQRNACVDDVVNHLKNMLLKEHKNDQRLKDLITLLKRYTKGGLYGDMFNGVTPSFNDNPFVVFELGALESNKELLSIVVFVMITVIQGQFYNSPRDLKKRCIIDEAWRYITNGDNEICSRFIVQGFRTARKHNGGFGVITQGLSDLTKTSQGLSIKESSSISYVLYQEALSTYINNNPDEFNDQQIKILGSFGRTSQQGFSSVMVQCGQAYTFHRFFLDPFTRILFSSKGDEFTALKKLTAQGKSIVEAVEIVSKHYFGDEL